METTEVKPLAPGFSCNCETCYGESKSLGYFVVRPSDENLLTPKFCAVKQPPERDGVYLYEPLNYGACMRRFKNGRWMQVVRPFEAYHAMVGDTWQGLVSDPNDE